MQELTPGFEQILISRIKNERVLEPIVGFGREPLNQQDVGLCESLKCLL